MERIDKINYYLDIAETVVERGTCLRRNFGAIIVKNKITNSNMKRIKPLLDNWDWITKLKAPGSAAIIPIIMIMETPLPIPLSVILSPNHIENIVPVARIILLENQKIKGLTSGATAPIDWI